jgi:hypothetical protein
MRRLRNGWHNDFDEHISRSMRRSHVNSINFLRVIRASCYAVCLTVALMVAGTGTAQPSKGQPASKPIWPNNGIAQRRFPGGYNMFVENDHGHWHAWVMNGIGAKAQALDFFSGKIIRVEADLLDNGQQDAAFTDSNGKFHNGQDSAFKYPFFLSWSRGMVPAVGGLAQSLQDFTLDVPDCPEDFLALEGGKASYASPPKWIQFPIVRDLSKPGESSCRNGSFAGGFESTLDLGDGTFLATTGCWVFRLRESDLAPVGPAPALRIVNGVEMRKAIDEAKGKNLKDAATYLEKALHLDIDAANSCDGIN